MRYACQPVSPVSGLQTASSSAASSASSVQPGRPLSASAPEAPTPSMAWGFSAVETRREPEPQGPAMHTGGHSREARAAFLLQHGWGESQQQQVSSPAPGARGGDPHKASARFGSPIDMDPRWHPSREVRMPARPQASSASGAAVPERLTRPAAASQPSWSALSAAGRSSSGMELQREARRYHLPGQLSAASDWDVARATATPGSVNQPAAAPPTSRCYMPAASP